MSCKNKPSAKISLLVAIVGLLMALLGLRLAVEGYYLAGMVSSPAHVAWHVMWCAYGVCVCVLGGGMMFGAGVRHMP